MVIEADVFVASEHALVRVIDQIRPDQWHLRLPDWFSVGGGNRPELDLRRLVNYHAYDTAWVPDVLAGRTIAEVGDSHQGDLLGADPRASYRRYAAEAVAAVRALDDPDRTVHLSYGDFPAREYLTHVATFRTFRAYDLARLVAVDRTLPESLVTGMWQLLEPTAEQWRAIGVFGPRVAVPADASAQDRLLGLAGRDPAA